MGDKSISFPADDSDSITNLLSEMEIMAKVNHENVIRLYGCCTQPELLVIMEYAEHGNLRDFLSANKPNDGYLQPKGVVPLSSRQLLRFCYQIASGVKHLTDNKVCFHKVQRKDDRTDFFQAKKKQDQFSC